MVIKAFPTKHARIQPFPGGPNANFYRNPYNLCFSKGGVRTPLPLVSAHENIRWMFVCFDSLHPINNLSDIKGRIFLCWTSSKLGLMFLLKDTTQWRRWGSKFEPSVSSQALYHGAKYCAPTSGGMMLHLICSSKSFLPDLFCHYRLKNSLFLTFHILLLHTE